MKRACLGWKRSSQPFNRQRRSRGFRTRRFRRLGACSLRGCVGLSGGPMGGDDSQKLLPWRGDYFSPGRNKPPAHSKINTLAQRVHSRVFMRCFKIKVRQEVIEGKIRGFGPQKQERPVSAQERRQQFRPRRAVSSFT